MRFRIFSDQFRTFCIQMAAFTGIFVLTLLFFFILKESAPAIKTAGWEMLSSSNWYPTYSEPEYGLLVMLINSLIVTLGTSLIVLPLGYGLAFFLYEFARPLEKTFIKSAIDLLSGVPSVIIGSFLLVMISPQFLKVGIYSTENLLLTMIGLTLLSLPFTASLIYDALSGVRSCLREGALALGATRSTAVLKVVSRAAKSGLVNALILTVNRVIGETMVVLMVLGGAAIIPQSLFDPLRPLTAVIASEMGEVEVGSIHYSSLFFAGLVLFVLSFFLTVLSQKMIAPKTRKLLARSGA